MSGDASCATSKFSRQMRAIVERGYSAIAAAADWRASAYFCWAALL